MKHRSDSLRHWRQLCADLREEDGIDPRITKRKEQTRSTGPDRKLGPLCRAVAKAVHLALADCGDPLLRDLAVYGVDAAPDAGRLRVVVGPAMPSLTIEPAAALARLEVRAGYLRAQVAQAIVRRHAPELIFVVMPTFGHLPGPEVQP